MIELDLRDDVRHGVVIELDDRVATIVVGEPGGVEEEWYFPASMVPAQVAVNDLVVLEGAGRSLRITGPDPLGVESRLQRGMAQRRLAGS